jgi:hypothetical protein
MDNIVRFHFRETVDEEGSVFQVVEGDPLHDPEVYTCRDGIFAATLADCLNRFVPPRSAGEGLGMKPGPVLDAMRSIAAEVRSMSPEAQAVEVKASGSGFRGSAGEGTEGGDTGREWTAMNWLRKWAQRIDANGNAYLSPKEVEGLRACIAGMGAKVGPDGRECWVMWNTETNEPWDPPNPPMIWLSTPPPPLNHPFVWVRMVEGGTASGSLRWAFGRPDRQTIDDDIFCLRGILRDKIHAKAMRVMLERVFDAALASFETSASERGEASDPQQESPSPSPSPSTRPAEGAVYEVWGGDGCESYASHGLYAKREDAVAACLKARDKNTDPGYKIEVLERKVIGAGPDGSGKGDADAHA